MKIKINERNESGIGFSSTQRLVQFEAPCCILMKSAIKDKKVTCHIEDDGKFPGHKENTDNAKIYYNSGHRDHAKLSINTCPFCDEVIEFAH